jgi:hypothetical protein
VPFEGFVRPYQSPGTLGRIRIAATPGATKERARLTWGSTSDGKITPARSGTNVECCKRSSKQSDHKDSDFEDVAVVAPDGGPSAGQRVDFQRANKLKFKQREESSCISDWDQMSGVALGTSEALAEFEADMAFAGDNSTSSECGVSWSLHNTPDGKAA